MPSRTQTGLETLVARLAKIDDTQSGERATREIAVNPVIGALAGTRSVLTTSPASTRFEAGGWTTPFRGQGRNLVLIEVKRVGSDLDEHQEQLLRYAFDEGVQLAALTTGLVWWLYLPRADAKCAARRRCDHAAVRER